MYEYNQRLLQKHCVQIKVKNCYHGSHGGTGVYRIYYEHQHKSVELFTYCRRRGIWWWWWRRSLLQAVTNWRGKHNLLSRGVGADQPKTSRGRRSPLELTHYGERYACIFKKQEIILMPWHDIEPSARAVELLYSVAEVKHYTCVPRIPGMGWGAIGSGSIY